MQIKQSPEDFIVEEIPDFNIDEIKNNKGSYAVYRLKKINLNTEQAIEIICQRFHIPRNNIKYAGTKDKNAVTTQYISIYKDGGKIKIEDIDLTLDFAGFLDEPLSLGSLKGNKFEIKLKNETRIINNIPNSFKVPNYFDEQRFSTNNFEIGLSILKKDFKEAANLISQSEGHYENIVKEYLDQNPNDFVGAVKKIPKKIITMYLHSVQSWIFNQALANILKNEAVKNNFEFFEKEYSKGKFVFYKALDDYDVIKIKELELFGFGSELKTQEIKNVLNELSLKERDFIIKAIPDLSLEGNLRECFSNVENIEINEKIKFTLNKGSYATIVLKQLFI